MEGHVLRVGQKCIHCIEIAHMVVTCIVLGPRLSSIGSPVDRDPFYLKNVSAEKHLRDGMLAIDFSYCVSIHNDSDLFRT